MLPQSAQEQNESITNTKDFMNLVFADQNKEDDNDLEEQADKEGIYTHSWSRTLKYSVKMAKWLYQKG